MLDHEEMLEMTEVEEAYADGHVTGDGYVYYNSHGSPIKAWVDGVTLDHNALAQARRTAELPFIHKHVALMSDAHWGLGATVGSVIPTHKAIVPAACGVDLGCGMVAQRTTLNASDLPDNLGQIRSEIEKNVPHGRTDRGGRNDRGAWRHSPGIATKKWNDAWKQKFSLKDGLDQIVERSPKIGRAANKALSHLGTLGSGNHFIEICLDQDDRVWVMLHSGSRGIGNAIGRHFIELAKEDMRRFFINLPDKDLSYLAEGTQNFNDYVKAVSWAQRFAYVNREVMMHQTMEALRKHLKPFDVDESAIQCHHNYIERENHFGANVWVTRKGAVRARKDDMGIIPGSMGARSFIVRGKGNPMSFHSCSHGAGRVMSRGEAKNTISVEQHKEATAGVECRKDAGVIDESPMAYKPIEAVMEAQKDLVEIVHTLKQVVCVKG